VRRFTRRTLPRIFAGVDPAKLTAVFAGRRVAVVVPARDEAEWLSGVVRTMPAFVDDVIVVDDGSTDDTAEIARAEATVLISHASARGVGAAITTGYRHAMTLGAEIVAVMAGDGQMCPADLHRLLEPIASGRADYAKGDRLHHPDVRHTMPRSRRFAGHALSALTGLATGMPGLSDSQSGYTAISSRALGCIDLDRVWTGYGYPNDLLGHLARAGARVVDVPIRPVYRGEKSGIRAWHVAVILGLLGRAAVLRVTMKSVPGALTSRVDAQAPPTAS